MSAEADYRSPRRVVGFSRHRDADSRRIPSAATGPFTARRLLCLVALFLPGCGAPAARQTRVFTSTREVTCLAVDRGGALWAGTSGGVLRREPGGAWRKWTRADGLPSNEARGISVTPRGVEVRFPTARALWKDGGWSVSAAKPPDPDGETASAVWRGARYAATMAGLTATRDGKARTLPLPLPPSDGTHVSALLPRGDALWAAMYGDGLWSWDGAHWQRLDTGLPDAAREVTAMAADGGALWIGTRRAGVWRYAAGRWTGFQRPDEPAANDIQAMAWYHGALFAATLQDGLLTHSGKGWARVPAGALSAEAPRRRVVFRGRLYVRNGDGRVDAFDGHAWSRDVFRALPRRQVSALATDGRTLYLAQWGGWSEWDGAAFTHHLDIPALQGIPVTTLLPAGDALYIGTQGSGVARAARGADALEWLGAAAGLPDDWVTALASFHGSVYAGTFVGGLSKLSGRRWTAFPALAGQDVTDLAVRNGALFAATRKGLFRIPPDGPAEHIPDPALEPEVQALCAAPDALWAGGRTGVYRLALPERPPDAGTR